MKYIVIGGGVAAFESAVGIRANDENGEITLLSREKVLPYRRPALSGFPESVPADGQFFIKNQEFYSQNNINIILDAFVDKIDTENKIITIENRDEKFSYDKLIIATGGEGFIPPIDGINIPETMVLREYSDAIKLNNLIDNGIKNITILGGGVLGLELAESLLSRNCQVNIIEAFPELLARNMDADGGRLLQKYFQKIDNLKLNLNCKVEKIQRNGENDIEIHFNGEVLKSQVLIVSAGVMANIKIAKEANIVCNRGIVVDEYLSTNIENIFAAGDVAEFKGQNAGLYLAAKAMGTVAGKNAVVLKEKFTPVVTPVRMQFFGIKIFSVGKVTENSKLIFSDINEYKYAKEFYDDNNNLVGGVLIGDISGAMALQKRIIL